MPTFGWKRAWRSASILVAALAVSLSYISPTLATDDVAGNMITFNNNGGWSWFEDERAIVDLNAGKILVSSVANGAGTDGANRNADVEIASYDLTSNNISRFTLADNFQA